MSAADAFDLVDVATRNAVLRGKVKRLEDDNQQLREALADLLSWQPVTPEVFGALHPQHQEAAHNAEAVLARVEKNE